MPTRAPAIRIDDVGDPRIAAFRDLGTRELRTDRAARAAGLFVAEGRLVLERLLASRHRLRAVFADERRLAELAPLLALAPADAPVYCASAELHELASGVRFHQGLLALAQAAPEPPLDELVARATRIVVLEGAVNHENLGAVFRNVAALAGDRGAVLLDPRSADPLYRKSVRVSMGWALQVPWARLEPWPAGIAGLRARGVRTLALTPREGARDLARVEVAAGERVALLAGSEGPGLSDAALAAAEDRVRIPIDARVDSLNLATAVAIALHRIG